MNVRLSENMCYGFVVVNDVTAQWANWRQEYAGIAINTTHGVRSGKIYIYLYILTEWTDESEIARGYSCIAKEEIRFMSETIAIIIDHSKPRLSEKPKFAVTFQNLAT